MWEGRRLCNRKDHGRPIRPTRCETVVMAPTAIRGARRRGAQRPISAGVMAIRPSGDFGWCRLGWPLPLAQRAVQATPLQGEVLNNTDKKREAAGHQLNGADGTDGDGRCPTQRLGGSADSGLHHHNSHPTIYRRYSAVQHSAEQSRAAQRSSVNEDGDAARNDGLETPAKRSGGTHTHTLTDKPTLRARHAPSCRRALPLQGN